MHCHTYTVCVKYFPSAKFGFSVLSVKGKRSAREFHTVELSNTVLKKHRNTLGLLCGCYGTLHRQIAHIADRRTARRTG